MRKNYVLIKQRHQYTRRLKKGQNKHFEYIYKPLTLISRPIDICSFIGCRSEKEKKISKLYFNTDTYPGPKNNYWDYDAWDNDTFQSLKFYIEKCARKNGSPVICNGARITANTSYAKIATIERNITHQQKMGEVM